jgi:RimJ/RimL family protein N-acetyltransferase
MKNTILKGNCFVLRHIKMSDLQGYFECVGDKKLKQFLLRIPANLEEAKKGLRMRIADFKKKKPFGETFAIELDGKFAGYVDITHLNLEHHEHKGEIGYCVHPDFRGKGLATKAVKLLTD